eukprot:1715393-Prymnesium_polylepis.1
MEESGVKRKKIYQLGAASRPDLFVDLSTRRMYRAPCRVPGQGSARAPEYRLTAHTALAGDFGRDHTRPGPNMVFN